MDIKSEVIEIIDELFMEEEGQNQDNRRNDKEGK